MLGSNRKTALWYLVNQVVVPAGEARQEEFKETHDLRCRTFREI